MPLPRTEFSQQTINAVHDTLIQMMMATKELIGPDHVFNIFEPIADPVLLDKLFYQGLTAGSCLPDDFKEIKEEFYQHLDAEEKNKLEDYDILLHSDVATPRCKKFADVFLPEIERGVNRICIFTSQIYLWQFMVNQGLSTARIPELVNKLSHLMLYQIKSRQILVRPTVTTTTAETSTTPSYATTKSREFFKGLFTREKQKPELPLTRQVKRVRFNI